jgi:hypothetical protein
VEKKLDVVSAYPISFPSTPHDLSNSFEKVMVNFFILDYWYYSWLLHVFCNSEVLHESQW